MTTPKGPAKAPKESSQKDSQNGNKNFSIPEVIEKMDPPFRDAYKDPSEIQNYAQDGSYFHKKNISEIRDLIEKNALEHGLLRSQLADFKNGSKLWKNEKREAEGKIIDAGDFEGLIRQALKILDNDDQDSAMVRNGAGFNKKDGEPARELINKDEWNHDDLMEAYSIVLHYSKTQLKDRWNDIAEAREKYLSEAKESKKKDMPDGIWNAIEYLDEVPVSYAGWYEGKPHKLKVVESAKDVSFVLQKITLRNYDDREIQNKIRRLKIKGMDMVEFNDEIFTKNDFVNMMVFPSYCNIFTECVNSLPIDDAEYREPKLYKENGFIRFPEKFYARRDDSYQRMLKDALNIGKVDPEIYNEAISLMAKHPKQLTLHYAIIGANIINVIGVEDYLNTIDAIGESDSGKSFVIDSTLQICYGISNVKLQDDAMSSGFRHHNIAGSTNLPIHIEEATMDEKSLKRLKSTGKNVRGNSDKSLTVYNVEITFIFSRNTESKDMKNTDPNEQKAINKRVHKFLFLPDDVINDNQEKIQGANFILKIKQMPGGLLYERLKSKPIREILKKYHELKAVETKPEYVISKLGAWIMDNPDFVPVVTEVQPPTILDEFFGKILDSWNRILMMNDFTPEGSDKFHGTQQDSEMRTKLYIWKESNERKFAISASGFNLIKKSFDYNGNAKKFADSYNFKYTTHRYGGDAQASIVGVIPNLDKENETPETPRTKEEWEKRQLDGIL